MDTGFIFLAPVCHAANVLPIFYLGILAATCLSYATARFPTLLPVFALLILSIFSIHGLEFVIIGMKINFLQYYLLLTLFFILFRYKTRAISHLRENLSNRIVIFFIIGYCASIIITTLYNYFAFSALPIFYIHNFIVSLLALICLLVPPKSFFDERTIPVCGLAFIILLLFFIPSAIESTILAGDRGGFGRIHGIGVPEDIWQHMVITTPLLFDSTNSMTQGWLYIDGNSKDYIMVLFAGFITYFYYNFLFNKSRWLNGYIFFGAVQIIFAYFYVCRYFSSIITFFVLNTIFLAYAIYSRSSKNGQKVQLRKIFILSLHLVVFFVLTFSTSRISSWPIAQVFHPTSPTIADQTQEHATYIKRIRYFIKHIFAKDNINQFSKRFVYFKNSDEGTNRTTYCLLRLKKLIREYPISGFGFPGRYEEINDPKNPYYSAITGHSHQFDNYAAFGIPLGLVANYLFVFPLVSLLYLQRKRLFSPKESLFWFSVFLTTSMASGFGKFGDQGSQLFVQLYLCCQFTFRFSSLKRLNASTESNTASHKIELPLDPNPAPWFAQEEGISSEFQTRR